MTRKRDGMKSTDLGGFLNGVDLNDPDDTERRLIETGQHLAMNASNDMERDIGYAVKFLAPGLANLLRDKRIEPQAVCHAMCHALAMFCSLVVGGAVPAEFKDQAIRDVIDYFTAPFKGMTDSVFANRSKIGSDDEIRRMLKEMYRRGLTPKQAADEIAQKMGLGGLERSRNTAREMLKNGERADDDDEIDTGPTIFGNGKGKRNPFGFLH